MADDPVVDALNPFPERKGESDLEARIRSRAYELWENAGRSEGTEHEHWFAAERELAENDNLSLGKPTIPGESIASMDSGDITGIPGEDIAPMTAGASAEDAGVSDPIANRNAGKPRKAGVTPRPTNNPISGD